jgi:hypothetical protein
MLMCCCFVLFRLEEVQIPTRVGEQVIDLSLQLEDELDGRLG